MMPSTEIEFIQSLKLTSVLLCLYTVSLPHVAFPASVNCEIIMSGRSSGEKEEVDKCNPQPVPYLKLACLI